MEIVGPIAGSGGPVMIASLPERPLDRRLADPSLLAHLFVNELDYTRPATDKTWSRTGTASASAAAT
ncbi:hypothetical protein BE17_38100 [Sorangium cellulosum]|uniref:Uncharacterized protein n=1 Tax=Sorangium cellulosum TaxID=56 RepID=A0A150S4C9_SORCE|nr:hypothetical protein BE17_38100 [Sorangium cellulosum]